MVRWGRLVLLAAAGAVMATAGTVLAVAVNVATGGTAGWFPPVERHPLWWTGGATGAVAVAGLLAWWAQRWYERGLAMLVPAVQQPERWVVERPAEVDQVVRALRRRGGATVGITIAVHGAGGFGKTTVAKLVRADRRVLRWFGGRVYWVPLGRDVRKEALARVINGLIAQIEPDHPVTFTTARQGGDHLAALLAAGPRRLLVLDDVWFEDQVEAFPLAGRCARLVTTRNPSLVAGASVPVKVDQMSVAQARAVLLADVPHRPPPGVVDGLVNETGRWPLLLRLINKMLVDEGKLHEDIAPVAQDLLGRIRADGALEVDQLTGAAGQQLDVGDPDQRQRAVRATIEASSGLLTPADRGRFAELAVFAEDETIPVTLIAALWQAAGVLSQTATESLCTRLADLALVTLIRTSGGGAITMHEVVREFLRDELDSTRLVQLHQVLLQAAAASLPTAPATTASGRDSVEVTAWWELPVTARYLWDHVIEHLLAAGQASGAEAIAVDLRWVGARLEESGSAGPFVDLTLVGTPRAERLRWLFAQTAHLLAPTDPPYSVIDILYSRVEHDPDWGPQVTALWRNRKQPALINRWPLPDLPDPALRRTLTGHTEHVTAVAIAPDSTWLATTSGDGSVRIWDAATGQCRATLTRHTGKVEAVAIAPDGAWLATISGGGSVRIWDAATGQGRATLGGHTGRVQAVAIAPDGIWLATGHGDGSVRIWDAATGQSRATLARSTDYSGRVEAVAIAPDGTWLATTSGGGPVRIWDAATGQCRGNLADLTYGVNAVAIAPDGTWLATGHGDGSVRIWDAATGQCRGNLADLTYGVNAVAIAPDGTWLATGHGDGSVRIWDAATGQCRGNLADLTYGVNAVAIAPDGTWLATTSNAGTVRIWDLTTGQQHAMLTGHTGRVQAVAIAPDGTWLATTSNAGTVRIWDLTTGQQHATLTGHTGMVNAVAIAPDGTWLATVGGDKTVRVWDSVTGAASAVMRLEAEPGSCVWSPCGQFLAVGGNVGIYHFIFTPAIREYPDSHLSAQTD